MKARLARGAALLSAYDEFPLGRTIFLGLTSEKNKFAQIAHLDEDQTKALTMLRQEQDPLNNALYSDTQTAMLEAIQMWIDDRSPSLTDEKRKIIIDDFKDVWLQSQAVNNPPAAWRLCDSAWDLLNLAKARNDVVTQNEIRQLIQQWQEALPDGPSRRWAGEALTVTGEPPTKLIQVITAKPNNTRSP